MAYLLNSEPTQNGSVIFVIIGVAVIAALYLVLAYLRKRIEMKKIAEQQARLKELEQRKIEAENSEIVDMVRGMSVSLTELPLLLEKLRSGETLGQVVPKSGAAEMEDN